MEFFKKRVKGKRSKSKTVDTVTVIKALEKRVEELQTENQRLKEDADKSIRELSDANQSHSDFKQSVVRSLSKLS
jgi:predicted RNase H-like nuclease (RuvC/YqgF family)